MSFFKLIGSVNPPVIQHMERVGGIEEKTTKERDRIKFDQTEIRTRSVGRSVGRSVEGWPRKAPGIRGSSVYLAEIYNCIEEE